MAQYIDKDALVAEIERLIDRGKYSEEYDYAFRDGNNAVCNQILHFLDTLEMKEGDSNDAFIEKATLWLTENASDYCILHNSYDTKELVEDFITAMKRD